jgi:shikimate dehydrogenase
MEPSRHERSGKITGAAIVAGVCGQPIRHSMSPVIHNAWIAAAGLNAAYVPFAPGEDNFETFVEGLRGGAIRGLNVTIPFKEQALACADRCSDLAKLAGAANLLVFEADGTITADNTDGPGLIGAIAVQAPGFDLAAVAGGDPGRRRRGAGRGGRPGPGRRAPGQHRQPHLRPGRGHRRLHRRRGRGRVGRRTRRPAGPGRPGDQRHLAGPGRRRGSRGPPGADAGNAVVVDMVYKPLRTEFLRRAEAAGRRTVDGLEMLLRQAVPSFEAFFGVTPPAGVDVRALALAQLGESGREMIVLGPHRLDRHGQVDDGQDVRRGRRAGLRFRRGRACALRQRRGGGRPGRGGLSGRGGRRGHRPRQAQRGGDGRFRGLAVLESIVHPLVGAHRIGFFEDAQAQGADIVVLDIPLLYETGGEKKVDKVVVVSAPADVQRQRVLARPGMDKAKFEAILARQTPDAEKRARADFVIDTGRGLDAARDQVRDILTRLRAPAPLEGGGEQGH